jgi:ribonuclease Z
MERIKITFLGTSSSTPTKKRNHTAILLSYKNENILIDCGEGTQRQFKYANLSINKINKILITHKHGDHTFGIPGLLQSLAMNNYENTLKIYGPKGIKKYMETIRELINEYPIKVEVNEVSKRLIDEKEYYIEAEPMQHGTPSLAYTFVIKEKIRLDKNKIKKYNLPNSPILKQLQEGKNIIYNNKKIKAKNVTYKEEQRKITFVLDTEKNSNIKKIAKNSNLLIIESTYSDKDKITAKEHKHLTAKQAAEIAKSSKVKKLILTHLSEKYEYKQDEIKKEAEAIFKNVEIAKDLQIVEI